MPLRGRMPRVAGLPSAAWRSATAARAGVVPAGAAPPPFRRIAAERAPLGTTAAARGAAVGASRAPANLAGDVESGGRLTAPQAAALHAPLRRSEPADLGNGGGIGGAGSATGADPWQWEAHVDYEFPSGATEASAGGRGRGRLQRYSLPVPPDVDVDLEEAPQLPPVATAPPAVKPAPVPVAATAAGHRPHHGDATSTAAARRLRGSARQGACRRQGNANALARARVRG